MTTLCRLGGVSKKQLENAYLVKTFFDFRESIVDKCKNVFEVGGAVQKENGLYYVQGNQSRIDFQPNINEDFTIEFVIKVKEINTYQCICVTGNSSGALQITYHSDFKSIAVSTYNESGLQMIPTNSFANKINQDTHVAIVRKGTSWRMYYDGELISSTTGTFRVLSQFFIGGYVWNMPRKYGMNNTILKMFKFTQKALDVNEFERI